MKNRLLNILLVTLALCFALQSCGLEEMHDTQNGAESGYIEFVARPTSYNKYDVATKTLSDEVTNFEKRIYTAFFMVFDNTGRRILFNDLTISDNSIPSQQILPDKTLTNAKVCFIANVSTDYAESITSFAQLSSTSANDIVSLDFATVSEAGCVGVPILTDSRKTGLEEGVMAIPMMGIKEDCDLTSLSGGSVTISLKRLLAKVDVNISIGGNIQKFTMTSATVFNIPNKVIANPVQTKTQWAESESSTDFISSGEYNVLSYFNKSVIEADGADVTNEVSSSAKKLYFYVPEHRLNITSENTDQYLKPTLVKYEGSKYRPTYVSIQGTLEDTNGKAYIAEYNIYLGANSSNNFDLNRNTYYVNNVTITAVNKADNRVQIQDLGGDEDDFEFVNLVERDGEAANCYIITSNGTYMLPAYKGAHKSLVGAPMCKPGYAKLLACDNVDVDFEFIDIDFDSGVVLFTLSGLNFTSGTNYGNAVIALMDDKGTASEDDDTIQWSWHLWISPETNINVGSLNATLTRIQDITYPNDYTVMDRNIGASRGGLSAQNLSLLGNDTGMYYKYGYRQPYFKDLETSVSKYWGVAIDETFTDYSSWNSSTKAQSDPCPPGYRVASSDIWASDTQDPVYRHQEYGVYSAYEYWNNILYPYVGYVLQTTGSDGKLQYNIVTSSSDLDKTINDVTGFTATKESGSRTLTYISGSRLKKYKEETPYRKYVNPVCTVKMNSRFGALGSSNMVQLSYDNSTLSFELDKLLQSGYVESRIVINNSKYCEGVRTRTFTGLSESLAVHDVTQPTTYTWDDEQSGWTEDQYKTETNSSTLSFMEVNLFAHLREVLVYKTFHSFPDVDTNTGYQLRCMVDAE